jgi:DNA gyrase subunit B
LQGFRTGLTRSLKKYADASGMLDKLKFDISGDDFREGLTAIISVKLLNLNLKDKLKLNLEVVSPVSQAVSEMIENYLEENPNDARIIVQK